MQILPEIFILFSVIYFFSILLIIWGLRQLVKKSSPDEPTISVLVAARNEAQRIRPGLESLTKLNYPPARFEIILVDDASDDETADIIQEYAKQFPNWHLIRLKEKSRELKGKKNALAEALKIAKGDLVFTTDADCQVPPNWLKNMSAYFDSGTNMVLGHSPLRVAKGFIGTFLKFDNLFSAIVAAAPAKLGFAHTSVGRNLAYRRSAIDRIDGYHALKKFRSGDDVHLTERFRRKAQGKIDYCAHPDTFVYTFPPSSTKEIFHQQLRKNSKVLKKSWPTILFSILIFLAYMLFIFLPFIISGLTDLWLKIILLKTILEFIALTYAAIVFHKKELIPWFPLFQFIYPFYVILFSLLGSLQIYEWKK